MKYIFSTFIIFSSVYLFSQDSTRQRKNIIKIDALYPIWNLTINLIDSQNNTTTGIPPNNIGYTRLLSESIELQINLLFGSFHSSWNQKNESIYGITSYEGEVKRAAIYTRPEIRYFLYHNADKLKGMYVSTGVLIGYKSYYRNENYIENETERYNHQENEYVMSGIGAGLGYQFRTMKNRIAIDVNGTLQVVYYNEIHNLQETNDITPTTSSTSTILPEISCSVGYIF